MIKVENITKRFGENLAVDNVSFEVKKGEVVGFLGRNGAGKTTTMNIITGYISSSEGNASVDGHDILVEPLEVKKKIGYLPEQPPLYLDMVVDEYLNFCCDIKKISKDKRKSHLVDVCDLVGISHMRKRLCKNLSKGYRQRVGLAQALIGNPEVLILDEPTVGLDPRQIIEIRNLIKDLGKSHTVILSSHILHEVADVCERVIIIDQGKIVAKDTLENLANSVNEISRMTVRIADGNKSTRKVINDIPGVSYVEELGSREENSMDYIIECEKKSDIRRALFNKMASSGKPILMSKPMDVTLEDIFLQLTTEDGEAKL
ncbi:MAG: ATP-binding cassette domain-containing protein [Clostridiales bacterium]|nr:ATP-binding cassette domain-containing protein [Clostridiales bacterium]